MGGRGASYKGSVSTEGGKGGTFYESKQYSGMSLHDFENAIRNKDKEYIGLVDKDGNIIVAGTSGKSGSVVIPTTHPEFNNAVGMTHNHPSNPNRPIGGSFSQADVENMAILKHQFIRAVAGGKNENTYIIRAKNGTVQNSKKLLKYAQTIGSDKSSSKIGIRAVNSAEKVAAKKGKTLTSAQKNQIYIGSQKRVWKSSTVIKSGYEYIEVKRPKW